MPLLHNVPLSNYTTWRVGGLAKCCFKPNSLYELQQFLSHLDPVEPILWLGLGSNTLVRDGGFDGAVILNQGGLQQFKMITKQCVRAEAGLSCASLSRKTARLNLTGLEFMAGIPGTLGGALRMNAGCHGGETWQYLVLVETIDRSGRVTYRKPDSFRVAYRSVQGLAPDEWFIAGWFELPVGDKIEALDKIKRLLAVRSETQPTGEYNGGSVFKNPPDEYAARLIEQCSLKGWLVGDAQISLKHANFIINRGKSTAREIEQLIELIMQRVLEKTCIVLEKEIHIVGEACSKLSEKMLQTT